MRENRRALRHRSGYMTKILDSFFADFYCQHEPDICVNTAEFYDDILHVGSAVLSGTCVFLFRSWMKDIFNSSNLT